MTPEEKLKRKRRNRRLKLLLLPLTLIKLTGRALLWIWKAA